MRSLPIASSESNVVHATETSEACVTSIDVLSPVQTSFTSVFASLDPVVRSGTMVASFEEAFTKVSHVKRFVNARGTVSARKLLRSFAPESSPANTLRWDVDLDKVTGAGIRIALLDSGLNWSSDTFSNARLHARDFTGSGSLIDPTGHGTANSALLLGSHHSDTPGIIPDCDLFFAKVLLPNEWSRSVVAIAAAIRWSVSCGVHVIILPFGASRGASLIRKEIRKATASGCQVLASAGNMGIDKISFPAWLPEVTAVSALTRYGQIFPECCATEKVDLYCWGEQVPVSMLGIPTNISGSSPAVVLAGGMIALRSMLDRQKHQREGNDQLD